MPQDAPLIINGDDDMLSGLKEKISRDIISYGIENKDVNVRATNIKTIENATVFDIDFWGQTIV